MVLRVPRIPTLLAAVLTLLSYSLPAGAGEGNEPLKQHREDLNRAILELASPDAGVRARGLRTVVRVLTWKGAEPDMLDADADGQMACRAVAEALALMVKATDGAAGPVSAPWPSVEALAVLAQHSDVSRRALASRLAELLLLFEKFDDDGQRGLIGALASLGGHASAAVPTLSAVMLGADGHLARHAAYALGRIGTEHAGDRLREAIGRDAAELRILGYWGWAHFSGEVSFASLRDVSRGLRDENARVQDAAAGAFIHQQWHVRPSGLDASAMADLVASAPLDVSWEFGKIQRAACLMLGMLGSHARSRAADLAKMLTSDPVKYVRQESAAALSRIDPSESTVERLVTAMEKEVDHSVRVALGMAIRSLSAYAASVRDRLAAAAVREQGQGNHDLARSLQYTIQVISKQAPR